MTRGRSGPTSRWLLAGIAVTLLATVVLRFVATSALWLDEAQTVEIARRSVPDLLSALRHDGSPPLYYLLLHVWIELFGTGMVAVRALSGVCAVAALPLMWLAARRLGADRRGAWVATLVLAANPFSIRYATEARMYSLVVVLWLAGFLAFHRFWSTGRLGAAAGAALATAALVLTHYWALFAVAAVGAGCVVAGLRGARRGWQMLGVLAIGCLGFVPWLSGFLFQLRHTGAPWGSPPSVGTTFETPADWAGSGPLGSGDLLTFAYYALAVLAVIGAAGAAGVVLARQVGRPAALLIGIAFATMLVGTTVSVLLSSAYASRYSAVALAPFLLAMVLGFDALPERMRTAAVAVVVALGVACGATYAGKARTQADDVAAGLASAGHDDLVVFCPDQLGPAVHRLTGNGRQLVYPTAGSPAMVDWVDYEQRNEAASPERFARQVLGVAGPAGRVWLVYEDGYPTFGDDCARLLLDLTAARGVPRVVVRAGHGVTEKESLVVFGPR